MASKDGPGAGSILMAFVLGAISGAAVALLWAPGDGSFTRQVLGDRAREGAEKAKTAAKDLGEKVQESTTRAVDIVQQGKEYLNRGRETFAAAVERGREAYQQAREREKEKA